ncbi:MAG TPA: M28 family metallopeptidase [Gemmatimonadaceae bacterium]|jgi:N-acetylated-alpha-linked acidic dipeptidase|nr:M28 family metallopeptidase [Gemmatimonadaceae bacterium]
MPRKLALLVTLVLALPLGAQTSPGYSAQSAAAERATEADAISRPSPTSASAHSKFLSFQPHMAGTPAQARTRDYVVSQMKSWGLETEVRSYSVWMPHPLSTRVWRIAPNPIELNLQEGPIPEDTTSVAFPQVTPFNGYGAAGDVRGDVVYVNYGLIEDYAQLDSMGVSVKGKIAIARYGRSYRGIKAREAEKHGAVGLLIYSDPADDGYVRGDVYPVGPMRPSQGIQRGSVMNPNGDPSTPGYPSTVNAKRIPLAQMEVPHIPVLPISYGNAAELLRELTGKSIPQPWQGGLPFRYHVGPGPVQARMAVTTDATTNPYKEIWDTFGIVRGSEFPDEIVMIGGHRDAWGPGAADNVSGTVSVLEAARAIAEQVKAGKRPKRTIVFATWDAEEWGLLGSTEYVEDDSLRLSRSAVAYLNQDDVAQGPNFSGGGSPSLRALLRDVTKQVPDPSHQGSVYDVWRKRANLAADSLEPQMGDPGGGSDFAGFYNHLGIPIADWGFGGPQGVYHSAYDSYHWMSKFGDPNFEVHATAARIGAATLLRIANADILPYDYVEFARTMRRFGAQVDQAIADKHLKLSAAGLTTAIARMEDAASMFSAARDRALTAQLATGTAKQVNATLLEVERQLTRPQGLVTRPWFRNLIYAADENNGYSTMVLPSVNEAIRLGDQGAVGQELTDLAQRFDAATRALRMATELLKKS